MKIKLLTYWLVIFLLVILSIGCTNKDVATLESKLMSDLIADAGWLRVADSTDKTQSVKAWLKAHNGISGQEISDLNWSTKSLGTLNLIQTEIKNQRFEFLLDRQSSQTVLLNADFSAGFVHAYQMSINSPFAVSDRISILNSMSNADAQFVWDGCIINNFNQTLSKIELRAVLLIEDENVRKAFKGKARHATKSSGIAKKLGKKQFFCSTLKSANLSKTLVKDNLNAKGVIEASWIDESGLRHFAPLSITDLDWRTYNGKQPELFAVIDTSKILTDQSNIKSLNIGYPALVTLIKREGQKWMTRTVDAKSLIINHDQIIALFPKKKLDVAKGMQRTLDVFVTASLDGKWEKIKAMLDKTLGTSDETLVMSDIARRFAFVRDNSYQTLTNHILKITKHGKSELLEVNYFVTARAERNIIWQTFDTVFMYRDKNVYRVVMLDSAQDRL